jgi:hypothetical protein
VCVVQEVIEDEEQAFNRTLLGGLKYFDKVKARLATEGVTVVPGKDVRGALWCFGFVAAVCSCMLRCSGLAAALLPAAAHHPTKSPLDAPVFARLTPCAMRCGSWCLWVCGGQAFFLYDSMGFPLDLTQRMAEESGLTVDVTSYNACMDEAKVRSQVRPHVDWRCSPCCPLPLVWLPSSQPCVF